MRASILLLGAAAAGLGLAGCNRPSRPTVTPARLDCPERQGDLFRKSVAEDGRSCAYRSERGAEVELRLIPVVGDARQTLTGLEDELRKERPAVEGKLMEPAADVGALGKEAAAVAEQASRDAATPSEEGAAELATAPERLAEHTGDLDDDNVEVDMPGLHVSTQGENAKVKVGPIDIDANGDGGAQIRLVRDVRLRGEALSREKRGIRATFILAGDDEVSSGWRMVGYEARGPRVGPLTVAIVRAPASEHDYDNFQGDVRRLVRRNSR